ncbi:hypothetical protein CAC42_2872 [Sphaceloma murrayae]|uniref:Alpha/beta hydrolase fold-3 domain-containing protein n=1 Tax=Sphaceloma murrayae TaxID=2082308 RepID=A0A2K1R0V8_9PEZI|nr:hypothetical protein CAC42_2872 [Sphaceloma murrayae]
MAPVSVTGLDKIRTLVALCRAFCNGWFMLLLRRGPTSKPLLKQFLYATLRSFTGSSTIEGDVFFRNLGANTEKVYLDGAKRLGFQPDTLMVKEGLRAHWIGNKGADRVILYFHGGGYVLAAGPGHVNWLHQQTCESYKAKPTSALMLSYALAPEAQYPTQLQQAAEALNWLLAQGGKRPSQIIIGGDSAGGNLALALFSHILHPHPQVPMVKLDEPLAGALLISPWVEFHPRDKLFEANKHNDFLGEGVADKWSSAFLGSAKTDEYAQPALAGSDWFFDLPRVVNKIFVYGGSLEVLIGSINSMASKLQSVHPKMEYLVEDGAVHTDFLIDGLVGYTEQTEGTRRIQQWLASV